MGDRFYHHIIQGRTENPCIVPGKRPNTGGFSISAVKILISSHPLILILEQATHTDCVHGHQSLFSQPTEHTLTSLVYEQEAARQNS
jgi:K+-transporting ATPase A subunit